MRALDNEALRAEQSQAVESRQLIADDGDVHKKRRLEGQRAQGRQVVDIAAGCGGIADKVEVPLTAMREGV